MSDRVPIRKLSSGVPGLDEVLGGGIPEFSFNLIAGGPGCGKTTLGHQIMFANASPERKAVYFSIIGEPPIKMLRYQQQYDFFDAAKIGDGSVRFIHLGQQALEGGMGKVLEAIVQELERSNPEIVVVDSFRAMVRSTLAGTGRRDAADRLHAAPRARAHQPPGDDVSPRGVRRGRARQRGVHGGRRAALALPGGRSQLRRAQAAGDEDARPGADPRAAHRPHHRRRVAASSPVFRSRSRSSPTTLSSTASRPGCRVSTR